MKEIFPLDTSLSNIWHAWYSFCKGKRKTLELETFRYNLEANLSQLQNDITKGVYSHGEYRTFTVCDNKKREIRVASIRDRVVHRLLYNYLVPIYDPTFIYDVWSCRGSKGLLRAIERAQEFLHKYPNAYVWRADISKFFDNVDQNALWQILVRKISDSIALGLLKEVISTYSSEARTSLSLSLSLSLSRFIPPNSLGKGMPIGNLTSQILANVYLDELDRLVKHQIKPKAYLRYGDDFIILADDLDWLKNKRAEISDFLVQKLKLRVNPKNDIIIKAKQGLHFLGVEIFPGGRRLKKRSWQRANNRLTSKNYSSYSGLVKQHCSDKKKRLFNWKLVEEIIFW